MVLGHAEGEKAKRRKAMSTGERWTVKYLDAADGSGDVIVELPEDFLAEAGLHLGDELTVELIDGAVVLKPIRPEKTAL